jgi:predicted O-methyltransferase YrrM
MDSNLEKYIADHTSPESKLLQELYRKTYTSVVNPNMISGHIQGKVLGMIVSMLAPSAILEIGTYTGYSAISMAAAMPEGSELHTIEVNDELYDLSSSYINRAGLSDRITMHTGDAKIIIPGLRQKFDLVFIDGDKREYSEYYKLVFPLVKPGGYILADNVLWDGKVTDSMALDPMTSGIKSFNKLIRSDKRVEQVILPLRDGLMIIRKSP